jgi:glycosyltransferase involved in cell wall biosynthesis
MKRVVLFSITYHPFIGGAEIAIKEFTQRLNEYEFDLFTAKFDADLPNEERIGNINVHRVGSGRRLDKWLYPFRASRLAQKLHKEKPYQIVHAIMATYAGLAALLFKKKVPSIPYLLTLQSGDSDLFIWLRTWFWYPVYRQIYTKANHITAISNWLKERARKYGYKRDIEVVPNGVNVAQFSKEISRDKRASIRENWDAKENDFVIITTSRLVYKNGVDVLVGAMKHLPESVRLIIVGTGKDEEKLKNQSKEYGDRVIFLGHVDHHQLPQLLKASDVFVRASRTEGLGVSFFEAMAAELPVIATPVGGIVDFIKDKDTGMFSEVNNSNSLANSIRMIMQDNNLRQNIKNKAEELVKRRYDWNIISEQYSREYQKLIK